MYKGSTNIWCTSTAGYGIIAEGLAAIRQRIHNVLMTSKGSDPLRPLFGCDVLRWIDAPINIGLPNLKASILEAIEIWMPEIKVQKISTVQSSGKVVFEISFTLGQELVKMLFDPTAGIVQTGSDIVLNAFFPPNPNSYPYTLTLKINGKIVGPNPPDYGFETIEDLFAWAQESYPSYGQWILLPDRISLRLTASVQTAELQLSLLAITKVLAPVPVLDTGFNYRAKLTLDGVEYTSSLQDSAGLLFTWITGNWGALGNWYLISSGSVDNSGLFFSNEFSGEFAKPSTGYSLLFVKNEIVTAALAIDTL